MSTNIRSAVSLVTAWALLIFGLVPVLAQRGGTVTVPQGTVIPLRMDTYLSSETSQTDDRFSSTVFRDVEVGNRVAVPIGSKIEGRVTTVAPAERRSRSGSIAIAFERLVLPGGQAVPVDGTLTTLSDEGRRQLEADEEDRVEGGDRRRRAIVFIGGGAGAGAVIGAIAGGGRGAAVGAGIGAVLGTIGVLVMRGEAAEVTPGTEFGMMVERAFAVTPGRAVAGEPSRAPRTAFTSTESIRGAQMMLRDHGYYTGPVNGIMTQGTRTSLRQYQRASGLTETGDLDLSTAIRLGIATDAGFETLPVDIREASASRVGRNSIQVNLEAVTRSGGWEVFATKFASGNTLHVYVRGVPPRFPATQGMDSHRIQEVYEELPEVTQVIFHGTPRDITVEVAGIGPSYGNTAQISVLSDRLLGAYHRDLNIRSVRNQITFDARRDLTEAEVQLLVHLHSLSSVANLYGQMVGSVRDEDALKGAAASLLRHARWVNRSFRRGDVRVSNAVRNDWEALWAELRKITVVEPDLEDDGD